MLGKKLHLAMTDPSSPLHSKATQNRRQWLKTAVGLGLVAPLAGTGLGGCGTEPDTGCRLPAAGAWMAVGDSLTHGKGAEQRSYPLQLSESMNRTVLKFGVNGERSDQLRRRLPALLSQHRPALVLVTSGGNDFLQKTDRQGTLDNLRAIAQNIRASGALPVFFAIPTPSLAALVSGLQDDPIFETLAKEGNAVIADVVSRVLSKSAWRSDPVHPNEEGYGLMAKAAQSFLERCTAS